MGKKSALSFLLKSGTNLFLLLSSHEQTFSELLDSRFKSFVLLSKEAISGKNYPNWPLLDARTIDVSKCTEEARVKRQSIIFKIAAVHS